MEEKISNAIRRTWSMSNTINQVILTKAIIGADIDIFDNQSIDKLAEDEINNRI